MSISNLKQKCFYLYAFMLVAAFFFSYHIVPKVFLFNIYSILLLIIAFINLVQLKKFKGLYFLFAIFIVWISIILIDLHLFEKRDGWLNEILKQFIVLGGSFLLSMSFSSETILKLMKPIPWALSLAMTIYIMIYGLPIMYDGRLAIPDGLGSPNSLGFVLAFGLILLLTQYSQHKLFKYCIFTFLTCLLWLTFSRSAIFGFVGGILFVLSKKIYRKELLQYLGLFLMLGIITCTIYMQANTTHAQTNTTHVQINLVKKLKERYAEVNLGRLNVLHDLQSTGGSGRLKLWITLSKNYLNEPKAWLTGFGPGWVTNLKIFVKPYKSVDSFLLAMLYSYGILGFIAACCYLYKLFFSRGIKAPHSVYKPFLGFFICFTLSVNDTISASQIMYIGILIMGYLLSKESIPSKHLINCRNE